MTASTATRRTILLAGPALLLILVLVVLPYANILLMSLREPSTTAIYAPGFTLGNYTKVLLDPFYLGLLWRTFKIALITVAVSIVLGYPVALHLARTKSRMRGLLYAFVLSPLLTGVVVRCFGWLVLMANNGAINTLLVDLGLPRMRLVYNEFGVIVACVHVFLPMMILPIMNTIQSIDPRYEEAARTLGATPRKAFLRVLLPLSLPGVQSGAVLVFVLTASAYVIPALLGGGRVKTMPTIIVEQLLGTLLWPSGAAMAIILAIGIIVVLMLLMLPMRIAGKGVT